MGGGTDHSFDGVGGETRRRLMAVAAIHLGLFVLAMGAGRIAGSQALMADALFFLGAGLSYGLSLWGHALPLAQRPLAALGRSALLVLLGGWLGLTTLYQFFVRGVPEAEVMALVGLVALGANGLTLYWFKDSRTAASPLGAVWREARNGMMGSSAVVIAAGLVALLSNGAPDLIVAGVMVVLFVMGIWPALRRDWAAWQAMRVAS